MQSGYFGMLTQGFPQLVRVNADVVRPDPSRSFPERSPVICQVRMVNETPLIPDLGAPGANDRRGDLGDADLTSS